MVNEIEDSILKQDEYIFANYGVITAIIIISFIFGFLFKEYVSDRNYRKQIDIRFKEKDDIISELKLIIQERAKKITVDKKDVNLFNLWKRIVKYFKPK